MKWSDRRGVRFLAVTADGEVVPSVQVKLFEEQAAESPGPSVSVNRRLGKVMSKLARKAKAKP